MTVRSSLSADGSPRFGVVLPTYLDSASAGGIRRVAVEAEALGFDSVWCRDHVMVGDDPAHYRSIYEAVTTLAWVAGQTRDVRLGTSVLVLPLRNPVIVAKQFASLDQLSDGRVILGVAAGYNEEEFSFLNANFDERGAILDEGIALIRHLWSADEAEFHGRYFNLSGHSFRPKPKQTAGPPIWIGGSSDRALRRAATVGDGWHGGLLTPEDFAEQAAAVTALSGGDVPLLSVGLRVLPRREIRHTDRWKTTLILGDGPASIASDVRRYLENGVQYFVIDFWNGDEEVALNMMRMFTREVLPLVER